MTLYSVFAVHDTVLGSESVILWQQIVEGGSCFLPPPPSGAKLWRKTPHHKTERRVLKKAAPCFRRIEPRKNRDSSLSSENLMWSGQSPLRESLCLQNTNCWEKLGPTPAKQWVASVNCTVKTLQANWVSWRMFSQDQVQSFISSLRYASEIPESVRKRISISSFTDGGSSDLTHLSFYLWTNQPSCPAKDSF